MRIRIFRLPKNQQFNYKPRFWDPKEEEKRERQERLKMLEEGGVDAMKERISSRFRRGGGGAVSGRYRNQQVAKSNFTLIAIVAVLLLICYLLFTIYLPRLEALLS